MRASTVADRADENSDRLVQDGRLAQGWLPRNLRWSVIENTVAQAGGRMVIALGRLLICALIIRTLGRDRFGEYSLLLALLLVAEWLLDFGMTDFFVREISRETEQRPQLLRMMTATKLVQIPAAFAALVAILFLFRYPAPIVNAGLVGGISLVFSAGVLIYRVIFRARLTMVREVLAELLSVVATIPLIVLVARHGWGLTALLGCYLVSRALFFAVCFLFGRRQYRPSVAGVTLQDIRWSLRASASMGAIGLLIVVYETLDLVLLSRLSNLSEVAYYSGAQRFIWPFLLSLTAIGGTIYPLAASYWPHARGKFEDVCRRGLDIGVLLTGLAVCPLFVAGDFFLGLLGPGLAGGVPALKILAWLCVAKAISATLGPVLFVLNAQSTMLRVVAFALALKTSAILALAPSFGATGVALAALATDTVIAASSVYLVWRFTGYCVRWNVILKVLIVSGVTVAVVQVLSIRGLAAAATAVTLYGPLIFLSGAVRLSELRSVLTWKTS